ncbi:hypothetical protein Naga_102305g1, partial [Nannochloropsis gaditana]
RSKAISIRRPTRASTGRSKPTLVPVTGGRSRPRRMARTLPPWCKEAPSIRRPTRAPPGWSKRTLVPVAGGRSRPHQMARTLPPWSIRASSGPTRRCACVSGRIRERNTFTQLSAWP